MNPILKRILFWGGFLIVIALIVWGLIVASSKSAATAANGGVTPITVSHPISSADWTIGSSSAPVQLIEYADFQCPACAAYSPVIDQLLASSSGEIYYAYRYFPLPQHANALVAAYAATAAGLQGQFWTMHDLLFTNQTSWQDLPDPTSVFVGYATSLGLNIPKFTADANSQAVKDRVAAGLQDATAMGLDYTPTLFINGTRVANPSSYAAFKALIDAAAQSAR
jgi:protein-disulfide isomerase